MSHCYHQYKETGQFDDLYVYLECIHCGDELAEDISDWQWNRYYQDQQDPEDDD